MKEDSQKKVYWEKQGVDSLCGVHCMNSLLQGPFFSEITLANMALQLDKKEQTLMAEQGVTKEFMSYLKEESGNVAMDGNYSIQVLQEALKTLNLSMVSIQTIKNADLTSKQGFICNSVAHWFAIRKVENTWYNLNSLGMRLPEIISDFYLSAFLEAVRQSGFQIFCVEGKYPHSSQDRFEYYNDNQQWYPVKRIMKYHQKKSKRKNFKPNISGGNDNEMQKAIAMSLGQKYEEYISSGEDSDWQDDNKKKQPVHFAGTGVAMQEKVVVMYEKFFMDLEDLQMISIMKMTLEQKYKEQPEKGIDVIFKDEQKKTKRTFHPDDLVQNLYDWIWLNRNPQHHFYLVDTLSRQKILDISVPLQALADPEDNTLVISVAPN